MVWEEGGRLLTDAPKDLTPYLLPQSPSVDVAPLTVPASTVRPRPMPVTFVNTRPLTVYRRGQADPTLAETGKVKHWWLRTLQIRPSTWVGRHGASDGWVVYC